jgi:predicted dehydrogenase
LIRHALRQKHVRGILAQKPLAMNFATAKALVEEAAATDKVLSVNQNMRFDQSMRVLKQLLERNELGMPVLGTIAEVVGIYIAVVAGTKIIPKRFQFTSWKWWMRAELVLWMVVLVSGFGTYCAWYLAPFR